VDLFYIAFFSEADVAGGYIAEHYYLKTGAKELQTLSNAMDGLRLAETYEKLRYIVEDGDAQRIVVNATENPPSLSSLLLNAVYGGHRLREIAYIVTNRLGHPTESGLYRLGELLTGSEKPL